MGAKLEETGVLLKVRTDEGCRSPFLQRRPVAGVVGGLTPVSGLFHLVDRDRRLFLVWKGRYIELMSTGPATDMCVGRCDGDRVLCAQHCSRRQRDEAWAVGEQTL